MDNDERSIPKEFFWRRVHSIFGLLILLFLIEHFLTNSQSALLFGESGEGFIRAVNFIKNLPYLPVIEILIIGIPILVHAVLGIKYLFTAKFNSFPNSGKSPSLYKYKRNQAYTFQRITSWILLIGIIAHVSYMRFYRYPTHARLAEQTYYFTRLDLDPGLYSVSARLGVKLYSEDQIKSYLESLSQKKQTGDEISAQAEKVLESSSNEFDRNEQKLMIQWQNYEQKKEFIEALTKKKIEKNQVIAQCPDFGTATLLMVRDSFKSVFKAILYTIFVLAASFHGFNGLWTFCITWGFVIKQRSQSKMVNVCYALGALVALLGLASIWGTYWINLAK
jgi:succinate dehydrogenase / fumarate reductase cytochrome b subunit